MFVTHCKVLRDEVLKFPKGGKLTKNKKKKGNKSDDSATRETEAEKQRNDTSSNPVSDETYHPVKCEQCNTEVGVFDEDEVYHFFNVLASYT